MARPSKLASLSVSELHRELSRRERGARTLLRKRQRLADKLRAINAQIAELGIRAGAHGSVRGRKRPRNESNLVEALGKILHNKTMSVTDVSEAVQKAGYHTTSPNFRTIVNQALIASGKFKRVDRGQYTAK